MTRYSHEIEQMHQAAVQLAVGFERTAAMTQVEDQGAALAEATYALIEMRRCCDRIIQSVRSGSIRPTG